MAEESSLWQSKIEPNLQGRIFSLRSMFQLSSMPIGYLLGGLLADYSFEPAMTGSGSLNKMFSWLLGSGKGSGVALMFFIVGILGFGVCVVGYLNKEVRYIEDNIPDHSVEV